LPNRARSPHPKSERPGDLRSKKSINGWRPMKTDMEDLIGKWSVEKIELLGKYSAAYLKVLQHQS